VALGPLAVQVLPSDVRALSVEKIARGLIRAFAANSMFGHLNRHGPFVYNQVVEASKRMDGAVGPRG
jgi:hypothetical protein